MPRLAAGGGRAARACPRRRMLGRGPRRQPVRELAKVFVWLQGCIQVRMRLARVCAVVYGKKKRYFFGVKIEEIQLRPIIQQSRELLC